MPDEVFILHTTQGPLRCRVSGGDIVSLESVEQIHVGDRVQSADLMSATGSAWPIVVPEYRPDVPFWARTYELPSDDPKACQELKGRVEEKETDRRDVIFDDA